MSLSQRLSAALGALSGQAFLRVFALSRSRVLSRRAFCPDPRSHPEAKIKKVFRIDIGSATDISAATLPATGVPNGVTAVTKSLFLDMLDPSYNLAGASFPEKLETLAFGPDLPDGRHLLLVVNDNDLAADKPSCVYAFAIDPGDLPGFQPLKRTP